MIPRGVFFPQKRLRVWKTIVTCPPADHHATEVVGPYHRKSFSASNVVGHGTDNAVGPFEAVQQRFLSGQVIPICTGWFGEIQIMQQQFKQATGVAIV
jgi:hypothetical protein